MVADAAPSGAAIGSAEGLLAVWWSAQRAALGDDHRAAGEGDEERERGEDDHRVGSTSWTIVRSGRTISTAGSGTDFGAPLAPGNVAGSSPIFGCGTVTGLPPGAGEAQCPSGTEIAPTTNAVGKPS